MIRRGKGIVVKAIHRRAMTVQMNIEKVTNLLPTNWMMTIHLQRTPIRNKTLTNRGIWTTKL